MKKIICLFACLFAGTANAIVLDFEGLTTSSAEDITTNNQGYGGFTWDSGWSLYNDSSYPTPSYSGSYGVVNNYGDDPLGLSTSSGNVFDFNGAWVSGWSFNAPSQIKAQGFDELGNLLAETGYLNVIVGVNQYLQADFSDVYRVDFVGGQYFTIDDLAFNESVSVPEPAILALLGLGLAGIGFSRKRKTA